MRFVAALLLALVATQSIAQTPVRRPVRSNRTADAAEAAVKQAVDQLASDKKVVDRDLEVLRHVRAADNALADTMQPSNAIQKAFEEVDAARRLGPEFTVAQGLIRASQRLDEARKSPGMADFSKLRETLRTEALGPASRAAVRNALRLHEETIAWLRVQQLISDHLRNLSEITGESLRATEQ